MSSNNAQIPEELRALPQWVVWGSEQDLQKGKINKKPLQAKDRSSASSTDPATWGTFADAVACPGVGGVGFVFSAEDPYVGIDLDHCRDPETGSLEPWAADIVAQLASYTEISPSGTGVHVIVRGTLPGTRRRTGSFEMYDKGRYFTMTGWRLPDTPSEVCERTAELAALHARVFEETSAPPPSPRPIQWHLDDDELIHRARAASNGSKFTSLWSGDTTAYDSQSEADLALCGILAFWTGPDQARIDRLFRQSGLMRDKWDEQHGTQTYGARTIATALDGRSEYFGSAPKLIGTRRDLALFPETDAGNAEAFAAMHAGAVLFDHKRQRWLLWGEHRWVADQTAAVRMRAKEVARERMRAAADIEDEERRRKAVRHALASESWQRLEAMAKLATAEPQIADAGDHWNTETHLIAVENGVLDLNTGALRPGKPDDRINLAIPIAYEAGAECPRWERFLEEIFLEDKDLISFVQRAIGYSLTGDVSEHALFLLFGTGRNGKSVLLNTMRQLVGDYGVNLPFSALEQVGRASLTPDLALLPDRRLVTSSETNDGARLNEARIKSLTGADPLTANPKYLPPFEFRPVAKFWLAVNHLPVVRDDSEGFWRRVKLIRFDHIFTEAERDPALEYNLREELPGILAWAVRGALAWKACGLRAPESVLLATESYRADSDPLADFIQARCVLGPDLSIGATDLYADYARWADQIGMPAVERITMTGFGRRMGERFTKKSRSRGKFYTGITLRSQFESDGFDENDEFGGRSQKVSIEKSHSENLLQNPLQPVIFAEPVTAPSCEDGCGMPVETAGALCEACLQAALDGHVATSASRGGR